MPAPLPEAAIFVQLKGDMGRFCVLILKQHKERFIVKKFPLYYGKARIMEWQKILTKDEIADLIDDALL